MATYQDALKNVKDTSNTLEDVSRGFTAKNIAGIWWAGIVLVLLTIATLFIVKKYVKNEAGNLWDFLTKPYRDLAERIKAAREVQQITEATGEVPTLRGKEDAKAVADAIYNCFSPTGDDEESLYNIIEQRIKNQADWEAVKGQFGVRDCPKLGTLFSYKHTGDMEHVIGHNLSTGERTTLRYILARKKIKTTI